MIPREEWEWFGHAGHLIVARWCRFHMATKVGDYLVSTVGEYWPERPVREIHAKVHDPGWLAAKRHLLGDEFDAAYMRRFGFEEIGYGRKYETMVFRATKVCTSPSCDCGMPMPDDWSELDSGAYNNPGAARAGHLAMCEKWANESVVAPAGRQVGSE